MISLITSLYKSDKYLDNYQKRIVVFADYLLKKKIDFEIIVIANSPAEKENKFGEFFKNKTWLSFIKVPRESLYATWNRGVGLAKGSIIGFWNVDDARRPEAMIDALNLFNVGAQLVYFPFLIKWYLNIFNFSFLVKRKKIVPPIFDRNEFTRSMHCGPFFLFSKEFYKKVGPFDEQFKIVGDFDWCVRAAKISNNFVLSEVNAGEFRVDGGGLSAGGKHRFKVENSVVFKRHDIPIKLKGITEKEIEKFNFSRILHKGNFINL